MEDTQTAVKTVRQGITWLDFIVEERFVRVTYGHNPPGPATVDIDSNLGRWTDSLQSLHFQCGSCRVSIRRTLAKQLLSYGSCLKTFGELDNPSIHIGIREMHKFLRWELDSIGS